MDRNLKSAGPRPPKCPLRVFLVEDVAAVRNLIIESLAENTGLAVAGFAETEESALSWLRSHPCDVLILDLELRRGNGLGLLKTLADLDSSPETVKIVYSNHVSANIRRLATQFGAAYFIDKTLEGHKLGLVLEHLSAPAA
jgi:DNA-binding NarL/FixJ family response regulator